MYDKESFLKRLKAMQRDDHMIVGDWGDAPYIFVQGRLDIGKGHLEGTIKDMGIRPDLIDTIRFHDEVIVPQDASGLFSHCVNLKHLIGMQHLDTSRTTNMSYMFYGTKRLNRFDDDIDTSHVQNMQGMFARSGIQSIDISRWQVDDVVDMSYMFCDDPALEAVKLNPNTHRVHDFSYCLALDPNLHRIQMNDLVTDHARNMEGMFTADSQLKSVNIQSFRMSSVQSIQDMFRDCERLTAVKGIHRLDDSSISYTSNVFAGDPCLKLSHDFKPIILITLPI